MSKEQFKSTFRISLSLHAAMKKFCKKAGISMTDFIESLLSKSLKRN